MTLTWLPTFTMATNESSYKLGYDGAFDIFRCLTHPQPSGSVCDDQGYTFNQYDVCINDKALTNQTADGYADGFVHWCASDLVGCSKQVRADAIPHMLAR